ncbi:MAG: glycosyltransferase [Candidatus Peribacteraceae bacterium]|nr:glycosyltransferase [Candidatus Peribacteraceae bacterium]MDD5074361.1 glycosyltransferase [Candidatus Peribacteraceae bacterium]
MSSLSIIIPTHRRADILAQCLEHIERQTVADQIEVIVVSDGHDDKTAELFAKKTWRMPLQFLEIEKSQQGVARNRGVERASAPLVLFVGDDMFLAPDACEAHVCAHAQWKMENGKWKNTDEENKGIHYPLSIIHSRVAVLGFVTWDPSLEINSVMRWLEESGWQFGYPKIRKYAGAFLPTDIQADFTYTSHISLPTAIARQFPFREDALLYGWEDIEWGMRLRDAGVHLFYEPKAKILHHHHLTPEQSLKRMETLGQSVVRMANVVPEFRKKIAPWKMMISRLLSLFPTTDGVHRRAFLRGIRSARNE